MATPAAASVPGSKTLIVVTVQETVDLVVQFRLQSPYSEDSDAGCEEGQRVSNREEA